MSIDASTRSVEVSFFITGQKLACFQVRGSVKQSTVDSEKQETALKSVALSESREEKNHVLLYGPVVIKSVLVRGAGCSSQLGYLASPLIVLQWLGPHFIVHSYVKA